MVHFRVRATSLGQVAGLLQNAITVFDINMAVVSATVTTTAGVSWQGKDATKFLEYWSSFSTGADGLRMVLQSLQSRLMMAEMQYTTGEAGVTRSFTGAKGMTAALNKGSNAWTQRIGANTEHASEEREEDLEDIDMLNAYGLLLAGPLIAAAAANAGEETEEETEEAVLEAQAAGTTAGEAVFGESSSAAASYDMAAANLLLGQQALGIAPADGGN